MALVLENWNRFRVELTLQEEIRIDNKKLDSPKPKVQWMEQPPTAKIRLYMIREKSPYIFATFLLCIINYQSEAVTNHDAAAKIHRIADDAKENFYFNIASRISQGQKNLGK